MVIVREHGMSKYVRCSFIKNIMIIDNEVIVNFNHNAKLRCKFGKDAKINEEKTVKNIYSIVDKFMKSGEIVDDNDLFDWIILDNYDDYEVGSYNIDKEIKKEPLNFKTDGPIVGSFHDGKYCINKYTTEMKEYNDSNKDYNEIKNLDFNKPISWARAKEIYEKYKDGTELSFTPDFKKALKKRFGDDV